MVGMKGVVISGQSGEKHHVGFGHGSARTFPLIADDQVVEGKEIQWTARHEMFVLLRGVTAIKKRGALVCGLRTLEVRIVIGRVPTVKSVREITLLS
jgi:hypothetical protein